ncbi:MAG: hypothetical protein AB7H88_06670 [Vicinamibacterales bacterium]
MPALSAGPMPLVDYYGLPAVRARMAEYLDTGADGAPTATTIAVLEPGASRFPTWDGCARLPPGALPDALARGGDVARSLDDTASLLVHLDLDYQNTTDPGEPFVHPGDVFFKLEPAYRATRAVLQRFGLEPIVLMTGRGYHFTAAVPLGAPVVDRLAALAPGVPAWFATQSRRAVAFPRPAIDARVARAATGLGLVLEHAAHLVLAGAAGASTVPVVVNGTVVGEVGPAGHAAVSIDLSFAGDPLDARHIRLAFGGYQFHRLRPDIVGARVATLPPLVALPRRDGDDWQALVAGGRGTAAGAAAAAREEAHIPDCADGLGRLLDDYAGSALARAHADFYAVAPEPPERWPDTYDLVGVADWPPCLSAALRQPNDLLLQPAHLQHLTRGLLAAGWHPRHIAGLVWSRYARDHGWGDRWERRMDAATRADFDVRVFAGLVATGLDRWVDLNCVSAQEKGLCPRAGCGRDLREVRDRLREQYPS